MANIKVQSLTSNTGADLFSDSESFIQDLLEYELDLMGGCITIIPSSIVIIMQMDLF
jgi:hypothetical protein